MSGRNSPGENKSKPVEASGQSQTSKTQDEIAPPGMKSSITVTPPHISSEVDQSESISKDKLNDLDQAQ